MSQFEVTSGELLYRLNDLHKLDLIAESAAANNLRTFLEVTGKDQTRKREILMGKILNMRPAIEKTHESQLNHLQSIKSFIQSHQRAILAEVNKESQSLRTMLQNNGNTFDTNALQSALEYFSVLKKDIEAASEQLKKERSEKDALKKQAKVCRDILLFSTHLKLETNRKVEISLLAVDSAQFLRCVRAVHDNIGSSFGLQHKPRNKLTPNDVRILNVFKVKNDHLSKVLQKHSSKLKSAKLRGLFCCLPPENVYGFTVFGINEQGFPEKIQNRMDKDKNTFLTPWIFADKTPLRPLNEELQDVHNIAGAAAKLALRSSSEKPALRFSKYSTISTIANYSKKQLEKGVLLALCRVLIVKQQTINKYIEDSDIISAVEQGYDTLYSSLTEEYVMLQPNYVVPEFLIHVFFPTLTQSQQDAGNAIADDVELPSTIVCDPTKSNIPAKWRGKVVDVYGENGVATETIMLRNSCTKLEENLAADDSASRKNKDDLLQSPSTRSAQSVSSSPQRNVVVKQTALNNIERAVEEYRSLKSILLQEKAERLQKLVKNTDEIEESY